MSHEDQGTGFDPGAAGHELQGRAAKPKRKPVRKPKAAAAEPPDEFAGLTARDCCTGCNEKKCVITSAPFCGHPYKASHPGAEPNVQRRIAAAKKALAHQKIEAA